MGLNSDHHLWWLGFALGIISGCSLRIAQINAYKKARSEGNNIFYDDTHRTSLRPCLGTRFNLRSQKI